MMVEMGGWRGGEGGAGKLDTKSTFNPSGDTGVGQETEEINRKAIDKVKVNKSRARINGNSF